MVDQCFGRRRKLVRIGPPDAMDQTILNFCDFGLQMGHEHTTPRRRYGSPLVQRTEMERNRAVLQHDGRRSPAGFGAHRTYAGADGRRASMATLERRAVRACAWC